MFTNLERYIKLLEITKLTQSQFLFLYCLYHKKYDLIKKYRKLFDIPGDNTIIGKPLFNQLLERGFIERVKVGNTADCFKIGQKFIKHFIDKHEATEAIFNIYPSFMKSNGQTFCLTAMDELVFADIYYQKIGGSLEEHFEIIEDIKYGIDNNLIKFKLESFLKGRQWIPIRKIRLEENQIKEGDIPSGDFG
jgi:hypothetical protein